MSACTCESLREGLRQNENRKLCRLNGVIFSAYPASCVPFFAPFLCVHAVPCVPRISAERKSPGSAHLGRANRIFVKKKNDSNGAKVFYGTNTAGVKNPMYTLRGASALSGARTARLWKGFSYFLSVSIPVTSAPSKFSSCPFSSCPLPCSSFLPAASPAGRPLYLAPRPPCSRMVRSQDPLVLLCTANSRALRS